MSNNMLIHILMWWDLPNVSEAACIDRRADATYKSSQKNPSSYLGVNMSGERTWANGLPASCGHHARLCWPQDTETLVWWLLHQTLLIIFLLCFTIMRISILLCILTTILLHLPSNSEASNYHCICLLCKKMFPRFLCSFCFFVLSISSLFLSPHDIHHIQSQFWFLITCLGRTFISALLKLKTSMYVSVCMLIFSLHVSRLLSLKLLLWPL